MKKYNIDIENLLANIESETEALKKLLFTLSEEGSDSDKKLFDRYRIEIDGSVALSNLPATGTWTVSESSGSTITGTGTTAGFRPRCLMRLQAGLFRHAWPKKP